MPRKSPAHPEVLESSRAICQSLNGGHRLGYPSEASSDPHYKIGFIFNYRLSYTTILSLRASMSLWLYIPHLIFLSFSTCLLFFNGVYILYNVMLVSAVQWSESAMYKYLFPPLGPLSKPTLKSHPSRSSQGTELSSLHYPAASHSFTHGCVYMSILISQCIPLPPLHVHTSVFYVCVYSCPANEHTGLCSRGACGGVKSGDGATSQQEEEGRAEKGRAPICRAQCRPFWQGALQQRLGWTKSVLSDSIWGRSVLGGRSLLVVMWVTICDPTDCSSLGKSTGVCSHSLFQRIFLNQGLIPGLLRKYKGIETGFYWLVSERAKKRAVWKLSERRL